MGSNGIRHVAKLYPVIPIIERYLHYALELWFEITVKRACRGEAHIVRIADDYICCFQYKEDAERFYQALLPRSARFQLAIAEEKTKIVEFGRFAAENRNQEDKGNRKPLIFWGSTLWALPDFPPLV